MDDYSKQQQMRTEKEEKRYSYKTEHISRPLWATGINASSSQVNKNAVQQKETPMTAKLSLQ